MILLWGIVLVGRSRRRRRPPGGRLNSFGKAASRDLQICAGRRLFNTTRMTLAPRRSQQGCRQDGPFFPELGSCSWDPCVFIKRCVGCYCFDKTGAVFELFRFGGGGALWILPVENNFFLLFETTWMQQKCSISKWKCKWDNKSLLCRGKITVCWHFLLEMRPSVPQLS